MEEKILKIINKVREMYRFDNRYSALLNTNPDIKVRLINDKLELQEIYFYDYDTIVVSNNKILYIPDVGNSRELITYKNWEELLRL